jgi:hypothetical protein
MRGAARSTFALTPFTLSGERVVVIETSSSRVTVCSMSRTLKPSLSNSSGQFRTFAHQMSAGSNTANHSSTVLVAIFWAMIALISSRAVNQVAGLSL